MRAVWRGSALVTTSVHPAGDALLPRLTHPPDSPTLRVAYVHLYLHLLL